MATDILGNDTTKTVKAHGALSIILPRFLRGRGTALKRGGGGKGLSSIMRAPPNTIANARRLRRNLSPPEALLGSRLRARIPGMPIFRRQHPIWPYVLDFKKLRQGAARDRDRRHES